MNANSKIGQIQGLKFPNLGNAFELDTRVVCVILTTFFLGTLMATYSYLAGGASGADDDSSHLAEIVSVSRALKSGNSDFWFDQNVLGYPLFVTYQPAPCAIMGLLAALTDRFVSPLLLYKLSVVLLWAIMPTCWYVGGRLLGLERATSLIFGLFILLVRDAWDFGLGLNSTVHYGLYTQLWATALLPFTLGSLYRFATCADSRAIIPVSCLCAITLCHAMAGLLCGIASVLIIFLDRKNARNRIRRLLLVWVIAPILIGFWLLPFFLNTSYQGGFPWKWESTDGYPIGEALLRVIRGDLLDCSRIPWLTALAVIGLLDSLRRWSHLEIRWLVLSLTIFFLLWLGPANWGPPYRKLPLHQEMQVVRYVMGLQVAGVFFSAVGLRRLFLFGTRMLSEPLARKTGLTNTALVASAISVLAGIILWGWVSNAKGTLRTFNHTEPDYAGLKDFLSQGKGRFLCHESLGTADHLHFNLLPLLAGRSHLRSYGRGYHDTLSMYYLDVMQLSPEDLRLYNVHHLVARKVRLESSRNWESVWSQGTYKVYHVSNPGGYFEFVRAPLRVIVNDHKTARDLFRDICPTLFQKSAIALINLSGSQDPEIDRIEIVGTDSHNLIRRGEQVLTQASRTKIKYELLRSMPLQPSILSRVLHESNHSTEYVSHVSVRGTGEVLLLKSSYHPYWSASIDEIPVGITHAAPNLMAIHVPIGEHVVAVRYKNPLYQKVWLALSALAWIGWMIFTIVSSRRRLDISPAGLTAPSQPTNATAGTNP